MNGKLINEAHVKRFILDTAAEIRHGWRCTRVSREALEDINARVRMMIRRAVHSHPSIGQTFKHF